MWRNGIRFDNPAGHTHTLMRNLLNHTINLQNLFILVNIPHDVQNQKGMFVFDIH